MTGVTQTDFHMLGFYVPFILPKREAHTPFIVTDFLNTPRAPAHPGKIFGTSGDKVCLSRFQRGGPGNELSSEGTSISVQGIRFFLLGFSSLCQLFWGSPRKKQSCFIFRYFFSQKNMRKGKSPQKT